MQFRGLVFEQHPTCYATEYDANLLIWVVQHASEKALPRIGEPANLLRVNDEGGVHSVERIPAWHPTA